MSYRVLIPTAGLGSRLGNISRFINKSLVSIANKPVLAHIIEQFPADTEFVIALGYKGHLIKEFLQLAYPERTFLFADVYPYEGPGSGLGLSILACKKYLQEPFVFTSCDTLIRESIPDVEHNWMGFAECSDLTQYRTIELETDMVKNICEKGAENTEVHKPYIGFAAIHDYQIFWDAMENGGDEAIRVGEVYGLRSLLQEGIRAYRFTWFDTGNPEALAVARDAFKQADAPNILEKANEAIWFINNRIIKFSDDHKFIANRVLRARNIKEFVPEISAATIHMYSYPKAEGEVLSKSITLPLFEKLLEFSQSFWNPQSLNDTEKKNFHDVCMHFYKDKTYERVTLFYKNFGKTDGTELLNGINVPTLKELLDTLDWNWLSSGIAGRFHGDFHFENILYTSEHKRFIFLDWRQEFGGSLSYGDIYYDLAKLLHGLIICHELISENHFQIDWKKDEIKFDFLRKQCLVECENRFLYWLGEHGYDKKKVIVLTALVFLNIAALHHYPYSLLLYSLGKLLLFKVMQNQAD